MTRFPGRPAMVAITALLLLAAGGLHVALAGDLPFETIAIGESSGFVQNCNSSPIDGEAEYVITNRVAWERFWSLDGTSNNPLPDVNFGQESVVAVVLGCFSSSGGPRIEITGIEEIERETRVHVLSDPRPGAALAISTPFHIVKVRRIKGPVSFFHKRLPEWFCNAEFSCPSGGGCEFIQAGCLAPDPFGRCVSVISCPTEIDLVCGCDGMTYNNDCFLARANVPWLHGGACQ